MHTCSVKLTFTDTDLYENFVEPRKINSELPTLVVRLLTAYATNDEIACAIDQFLDETENPSTYNARAAILEALADLGSLHTMAEQALEATDGNSEGTDYADNDGFVDLDAAFDNADNGYYNVDNTSNTSYNQQTYNAPPPMATPQTDDRVMQVLGTLTEQISNLTTSVTQLVSGIANNSVVVNKAEVETASVVKADETPMLTAEATVNVVEETRPAEESVAETDVKADEGTDSAEMIALKQQLEQARLELQRKKEQEEMDNLKKQLEQTQLELQRKKEEQKQLDEKAMLQKQLEEAQRALQQANVDTVSSVNTASVTTPTVTPVAVAEPEPVAEDDDDVIVVPDFMDSMIASVDSSG